MSNRKRRTGVAGAQTLTCAEVAHWLGAYHDDDLAPQRRSTLEAHLGECRKCRAYLKSYAASVRLAKQALKEPAASKADSTPEDLVRQILAVRARRK
jgi:anti-sigma factor RsiW